MDMLYSTELAIPLYQVGLLLIFSTLGLLFRSVKMALIINYLFVLYWGYWINRETVLGEGARLVDTFTLAYFGFGLIIVVLSLIGLLTRAE